MIFISNKKAAIALSVGFIVTFILTVVVFSLSVYFAVTFFKGAEDIRASIDEQTESRIQDLLSQSGTLVAFPLNKKEAFISDRVVFGVGALNLLGAQQDFYVDVVPHKFIDSQGNEETLSAFMESWLNYNPGPYTTANNDYSTIPLLVELKKEIDASGTATKKGTYIFNVCVFEANPATLPGVRCERSQLTSGYIYTDQIYKLYVTVK